MRKTGVLMAISSLPSNHGIGDFGKSAYEFVDYLTQSKINVWQILPFNRLGYGNSPYQSYSSIAGDEIFISLDVLVEDGLLQKKDLTHFDKQSKYADYELVRSFKMDIYHKAYENFKNNFNVYKKKYQQFLNENSWVHDYAVFVVLKEENELKCWNEWKKEDKEWIQTRSRDVSVYQDRIDMVIFLQFIFFKQWFSLKKYMNKKGIKVIGDIPFYVGIDSVDVWANQECFLLDKKGQATYIAGCPPDYFAKDGQRWGNPIYNWDKLTNTRYQFWIERLRSNMEMFDMIRIDHFRAFDTYWKIPATCPTAVDGQWIEAPGYDFFDELFTQLPKIKLIAEDLGDVRPEVWQLRDHYHFAGMDVTQFTFDEPLSKKENMVTYTGTHDNPPLKGWLSDLDKAKQNEIRKKLKSLGYQGKLHEMLIQYTLDKKAYLAIIPIQDILGLGNESRMNTPGTIGNPNWQWKLTNFRMTKKRLESFKEMINKSNRK